MRIEKPEADSRPSKGSLINLQDRYLNGIMEGGRGRRRSSAPTLQVERRNLNPPNPNPNPTTTTPPMAMNEGKKMEYNNRSYLSRENSRRLIPASYFSLESLLLLICLTASLLILPLILPPLPPPPFMLLLLPIAILAVLMILALMPSNVRDLTYTYM